VHEKDHIDICCQDVGLCSVTLMRCTADKRRSATNDVCNTLNVVIDNNPITDGDVCTDISHPQRFGIGGVSQDGAPASVDAAYPTRGAMRARFT
jgi:hypothetical protein